MNPYRQSCLPSSEAPLPILLRNGMSCAAGSGGELGRWSSSRVVPSSSGVGERDSRLRIDWPCGRFRPASNDFRVAKSGYCKFRFLCKSKNIMVAVVYSIWSESQWKYNLYHKMFPCKGVLTRNVFFKNGMLFVQHCVYEKRTEWDTTHSVHFSTGHH